jgi:DNA-binding CsgD family transcriptional regulator
VGYGDGLSVALFVDGGRYAGMLHMNADSSDEFDDSVRDLIAALAPTLGRMCDPTRQRLEALDEDFCAQIVTASGIRSVAGRRRSQVLTDGSRIGQVAARFLRSSAPSMHGLWATGKGRWHHVVLLRVRDPMTGRAQVVLAGDRPRELPYGLSPREIDVLTHLSRGEPNIRIAAELCIAPRTVATHIEHILDKLDCDSRAAAASRAVREGLVRLDVPGGAD